MSNSISQRSSTELTVNTTSLSVTDCLLKDISPTRVPQPPRLQHSPSLPNIWFPQQSGVMSRETEIEDKKMIHGPSAPPSPKTKQQPTPIEKDTQTRHVKYASIDPTHRKPSGPKTHTRRRTERDEPHSLLTPPLTPSSSIRTTASVESSTTRGAPINEEIIDSDLESTRILLLEHVSPYINIQALDDALTFEFYRTVTETEKAAATDDAKSLSTPAENITKAINPRLHPQKGIVAMIFYDVRSAIFARDLILSKKLDLKRFGDVDHGSNKFDIAARLVTIEDLFKINPTLGNSHHLDGIDASLTLSVRKILQQENKDCSDKDPLARGGINIAIFQNILKSYGSIRFLTFIQQEVDHQGNTSVVYRVEYHDLRHAGEALKGIKDQTMFGMKISVIGGSTPASSVVAAIEPFPNATTAGESFDGLSIQTAGVQSQMRERFAYTVDDGNSGQGQVVEAQQITTIIPNPSAGEACSPTFFYTTTPFDPSLQNLQVALHEQVPPQARGAFPEAARAPNLQMVPHQQQWEQPDPFFRAECISPTYPTDGSTTACAYCPSRNTPHPHGTAFGPPPFGPYPFPPSPPTPSIYYPVNIVPSPSPPILGYEGYVEPHLHPMQQNGAWNYDPNMTSVNMGMIPTAISPGPFFMRGLAPPTRGGARYPSVYHQQPNGLQQQQHQQIEHGRPGLQIEGPQEHGNGGTPHLSTPDTMSPASNHSVVLVGDASGVGHPSTVNGALVNDRNQLNLVRIRSGEDTRTTVMIKNIPNKMSDMDLTAYIGKVCPRKIDFLYLRMDFKNGCNVGYAFVNFINVGDLLYFADTCLGVKWNLFSSEKVLQMSYANYQGKEALVEKFKNSAIMDERESWRPRIFYSSGPNEGLPEPFPSPTHIRRKERSSFNRDTLFPPGVNSHTIAHSGGLLHNNNTPRRYHDDTRSAAQNHGRLGANGERFHSYGGRHTDGSGEGRREQRTSVFNRNFNQRAAAR